MSEEIDDIFGEDSGKDSSEKSVKQEISNKNDVSPDKSDPVPSIIGDIPKDYEVLVERIRNQYRLLPDLNYNELYRELSDLSVKANPTPTLQVINDEIQKVQASKDRLSEIFVNVVKSYNFKKRAVDILFDSWFKFTDEKSADKRKGDASFRTSIFATDLSETEGLFKSCIHIIKNLDSLHDGLSRRITVIQLQIKMMDYGRGGGRSGLPDEDLTRDNRGADVFGEKKEVDENSSISPQEESF